MIAQKIAQYTTRLQQINEVINKAKATTQTRPVASSLTPADIKKLTISDVPDFTPSFPSVPSKPASQPTTVAPSSTQTYTAPPAIDWSSLQEAEKAKTMSKQEASIPTEVVSAPPAIDWASLQQTEKTSKA
jgi:hypothetical protein